MKNTLLNIICIATLIILATFNSSFAAPPVNDNCSAATVIVVNAACNGGEKTTNGTIQTGEVTGPTCTTTAADQTVWYIFTATASSMYVQVTENTVLTTTQAKSFWMALYNTSVCVPTSLQIIGCSNINTLGSKDGAMIIYATGLTIGSNYLIQVGYSSTLGTIPTFCIKVGDDYSACATCGSNCGPGCGFATTPTGAQLAACAVQFDLNPVLEGSQIDTFCFTIIAQDDIIAIQVANSGTCGGSVTYLNWNIQGLGCTGVFQSGNLSDMSIEGLTPGNTYIICIDLKIPSDCYYSWFKPYFIGAFELPIELTYFDAEHDNGIVDLKWETASEINNDFFSVQRSIDGIHYYQIGTVEGAGTSNYSRTYNFTDEHPLTGVSYYRLVQNDIDGATSNSNVEAVNIPLADNMILEIDQITNTVSLTNSSFAIIKVLNIMGETVFSKSIQGSTKISFNNLLAGSYFITVQNEQTSKVARVTKTTFGLIGSDIEDSELKTSPSDPIATTVEFENALHLE